MTSTPARTADRMWHDVFLPDDVRHVRGMARDAVATHLAPVAREIAQREESVEAFPWAAFKGWRVRDVSRSLSKSLTALGSIIRCLRRASWPRRSPTRVRAWVGCTTGMARTKYCSGSLHAS
jgi:hypothetical protein